ncbi:MAG: Ig-like domain-containing protein [Lachnotalea sp.]
MKNNMLNRITAIIVCIVIGMQLFPAIEVEAKTDSKSILNSASVSPIITNYKPLDKLVETILDEIITKDMTNYEKVMACYNYLIDTMSYSSNVFNLVAYTEIMYTSNYSSNWDRKVIYYAYSALKNKKDSCYGYSAAFVVLTRAIGLESYVMQGQTALAKGGYGNHWWVNIKIDNKYYIFDPNVEDDIAKGGTIYYYRFCKLDSELSSKYVYTDRELDVSNFNDFMIGVALKSIKLSKSKATVYKGDNKTLTVTYKPTDATVTDATKWKSSNKKIASVSKNGTITAKKAGTAYITATVGNKTAKCKITVKNPYIKLNKTTLKLKAVGKTYQFKTKVSSNFKDSVINWKTSNEDVVTITDTGEITAIGKGTATITAYIGKIKAKCKVTVK